MSLSPPGAASCLVAATLAASFGCTASPRAVQAQGAPAPTDVVFKLTDLEYAAIPGVDVRIAFGPTEAWRARDTGTRFVTDAAGEFRFTTSVVVDEQPKKLPTNFADSLLARPQATDHLRIAAELPYMTFRWVYVVDLWRFRTSGDVLTDGLAVYTPDAAGRFTQEAKRVDGGWLMADLKGLALTTPGYEPWDFRLEPGGAETSSPRWSLRLAFKRSPPPVRR